MKNQTYDRLKFLGNILIPFVGVVAFIYSEFVNLDVPETFLGIVVSLTTAINAWLAKASLKYLNSKDRFDGTAVVQQDPGGIRGVSLELEGDLETTLERAETLTFDIRREHVS